MKIIEKFVIFQGLNLLRSNTIVVDKPATPKVVPVTTEPDQDITIMQQYLKRDSANEEDTLAQLLQNENFSNLTKVPEQKTSSSSRNPATSTTQDTTSITYDESSEIPPIFEGLKFITLNFSDAETAELRSNIEQMAGQIVSKSYKGIPDFAVVPIFSSELQQTASEVVTEMWIAECFQEGEVKEIMYYHRPLTVSETVPLQNCVVTLSTYTSYERNFLKILIFKLGGVFQEQFARVKSVKKNVFESTHLISPEATGKKYFAAIKWKLPVINKDWLLECAKTGKLVSENNFLVGDSIGEMILKYLRIISHENFSSRKTGRRNQYFFRCCK